MRVKWYEIIGNEIEMLVSKRSTCNPYITTITHEWVRGHVIEGYRTRDGFVNMVDESGDTYWCPESKEGFEFRKTENTKPGDLSIYEILSDMNDDEIMDTLVDMVKYFYDKPQISDDEKLKSSIEDYFNKNYIIHEGA